MKPVAFLFDNDGVLIDSSELHWYSWQLMVKEIPELTINREQFVSNFGKRNDLIMKDLFPHATQEERQTWTERKEDLFRQCARNAITLLPGMEAFLKKVVAAQIPHIIASSTPVANLELFLSSTVLGKYFDHYVSAEEVAHGKPAPDVFIEAAHRLGFEPKSCIVFEDAPVGIAAGKAAGCFVVALATTHPKEHLSDYDLIYPSARELDLSEILNAFNGWING